ncbi:isopropylmalate/homocitrate/citramalate synthase [bacterium]|nr:MAG: isopropylmalate/homocitrate/citramalate synthase [bacterium]
MNDTERLIREYFDAFNRYDVEALLATLSHDVVHDVNEGPTETGIDAFRKFKAHMDECYREEIKDLVVMTSGERGAAEFTVDGTYLKKDGPLPEANGQRYSIPAAAFFTVQNAKIVRITSYYNLKGWLESIG